MNTVILVPRRAGVPERDAIWEWCKARWQRLLPDVPIIEGHHEEDEGPFNRSMAINRAAAAAGDWDVALVIDADVFIRESQVKEALRLAAETGKVTWAHLRWRGLDAEWTRRSVADRTDFGPEIDRVDMDILVERTNPISWSCCIAIPRPVFDDLGGFDERFRGWGYEDMAFQSVIVGLYGYNRVTQVPGTDTPADVFHMWHPRSEERIVKGNLYTASAEYITNARLGRRYMVALRRDYALHDRPEGPMTPAQQAKDVGNLMRDDAKLSPHAKRLGLPSWDRWWPTLEELRDQAKYGVSGPPPGVTLIVHTDGRRDCIERAIPSLRENVTGNFTKRVIYDDSGDPAYKRWLALTFPDFYVVGPAGRLGQAGSMRAMWRYLDVRCDSDWVFAVEDDFLYDRPVDLGPMIEAMDADPKLAQMALLRGKYFARELEGEGMMPPWPDESFELQNHRPHPYLTHRNFFTFNPCLFRRSLTSVPMPGRKAETGITDILKADPEVRFGLWGSGEPWITHIGHYRMADVGY